MSVKRSQWPLNVKRSTVRNVANAFLARVQRLPTIAELEYHCRFGRTETARLYRELLTG